jgi:hypothetical protein
MLPIRAVKSFPFFSQEEAMNIFQKAVLFLVLVGMVFGLGSIPLYLDGKVRPFLGACTNLFDIAMVIGIILVAIIIMAFLNLPGGKENERRYQNRSY